MGLPWIRATRTSSWRANPLYAVRFFAAHGWHGSFVLGSVVLCITGGRPLRHMGHSARAPRLAWYSCVFPALLLTTSGRARSSSSAEAARTLLRDGAGAVALSDGRARDARDGRALAALISGGSRSRARRAARVLPRVTIVHTRANGGQIYVPEVKRMLMIALRSRFVLGFRESSNLAAAYGIARSRARWG